MPQRRRRTQKKRSTKRRRATRTRRRYLQRGGSIRLFVVDPNGVTHTLEFEPDALVGSLKPVLAEASGIPEEEQILKFGGQPLNDSRSLANSGIGQDASLIMALLPPRFVMPLTEDGLPDFGPRITGSLAEWRAANPDALIANITNRYDLTDADFVHLRGIKGLNMSFCRGITDAAFAHLAGIHTLNMSECYQPTITDAAFAHLAGIHTLYMSYCDQPTITDAAFAHLRGIHTLDMIYCYQDTITQNALNPLLGQGLQVLNILGCPQFRPVLNQLRAQVPRIYGP